MKTFQVLFEITMRGSIDVEAASAEEAERLVIEDTSYTKLVELGHMPDIEADAYELKPVTPDPADLIREVS